MVFNYVLIFPLLQIQQLLSNWVITTSFPPLGKDKIDFFFQFSVIFKVPLCVPLSSSGLGAGFFILVSMAVFTLEIRKFA